MEKREEIKFTFLLGLFKSAIFTLVTAFFAIVAYLFVNIDEVSKGQFVMALFGASLLVVACLCFVKLLRDKLKEK